MQIRYPNFEMFARRSLSDIDAPAFFPDVAKQRPSTTVDSPRPRPLSRPAGCTLGLPPVQSGTFDRWIRIFTSLTPVGRRWRQATSTHPQHELGAVIFANGPACLGRNRPTAISITPNPTTSRPADNAVQGRISGGAFDALAHLSPAALGWHFNLHLRATRH